MKERIGYYDIARGWGILFVVIGHIDTFYMPFRQYVISFHMALFLLISGMLIVESGETEKRYWAVVKKKWSRIMVPYFLFSLLAIAVEILRWLSKGVYSGAHVKSLLLTTVSLYGNSVMWFLPALFISELLFLAIQKVATKISRRAEGADIMTAMSVLILTLLLIWCNYLEQATYGEHTDVERYKRIHELLSMSIRGGFCSVFVCIGYFLRKYQMSALRKPGICGGTGFLLMMISLYLNRMNPGVELRSMNWGETSIWVGNYYITIYVKAGLYILGASVGALGVILLCKGVEQYRDKLLFRWLTFLGMNSLIIMATHLEFHVLHIGTKLAGMINAKINSSLVYHICVIAFVFAAEVVLVQLINRYIPVLVGKSLKNKNNFHK